MEVRHHIDTTPPHKNHTHKHTTQDARFEVPGMAETRPQSKQYVLVNLLSIENRRRRLHAKTQIQFDATLFSKFKTSICMFVSSSVQIFGTFVLHLCELVHGQFHHDLYRLYRSAIDGFLGRQERDRATSSRSSLDERNNGGRRE